MAAFRFALQVSRTATAAEWRDLARKAEDLGYATLYVPDHLDDQWAPMVALAVAAEATTTMRVGTLVLDNDFRHPVLMAKEAATLDAMTGGRFELGLGAGWLRADYDQSGIPMDPPAARVARLAEALEIIRAMWQTGSATFEGAHYSVTDVVGGPAPLTPGGPPLVIGGGSRRILELAGRHADIVSVVPSLAAGYIGPEVAAEAVVEKYADRVRWALDAAGERAGELELQCWTVAVQVVPNAAEVVGLVAPLFNMTPGTAPRRAGGAHRLGPRDHRHLAQRGARNSVSATSSCTRRRWTRWRRCWPNLPEPERPARIGIMGGTFDPPHLGHVAAARAVIERLGLDRLLLVVANDPWQKSGQRAVSAAEDRYALTEALAEEIPGAEASRIEIDRGGPSYSVDTAEEVLAATSGAAGRSSSSSSWALTWSPSSRPGTATTICAAWSPWPSCPVRPRPPRGPGRVAHRAGGRAAGGGLELGGP